MTRTRRTRVAVFEYEQDDHVWLVHDRDEPRCHTYGRTASKATAAIREAMAAWHDVDPADLEIEPRWELGAKPTQSLLGFLEAKDAETEARARARGLALLAVKRLADVGLSTRDTGTVLGFSHQRVAQLREELGDMTDAELRRVAKDTAQPRRREPA